MKQLKGKNRIVTSLHGRKNTISRHIGLLEEKGLKSGGDADIFSTQPNRNADLLLLRREKKKKIRYQFRRQRVQTGREGGADRPSSAHRANLNMPIALLKKRAKSLSGQKDILGGGKDAGRQCRNDAEVAREGKKEGGKPGKGCEERSQQSALPMG